MKVVKRIKSLIVVQFGTFKDKHNDTPSKAPICGRVAHFQHGDVSLEDEEHTQPPKRVIFPKVIEKVHYVVLRERKTKVEDIAKIVDIST